MIDKNFNFWVKGKITVKKNPNITRMFYTDIFRTYVKSDILKHPCDSGYDVDFWIIKEDYKKYKDHFDAAFSGMKIYLRNEEPC